MKRLMRGIIRWFRRWIAWFRKPNLTQLREFVYLDEISVVSLSSSLRGALAEEITDSESSTLKTDSRFELGARIPYLKSKTGYGTELSSSEGRQILRKSTIQSKYKDLMNDLSDRLKVFHYTQAIAAPSDTTKLLAEIKEWKPGDEAGWLKPADGFARGDLVEFEVELAADIVYGAGLTLSSMAGVLKRIGQVDQTGLSHATIDQLQVLSEVLTQLLIGLIPVKSQVVGWKVLEYDKKLFLITDDVASKLSNNKKIAISPLFITGVLEETLFWKDVRQVLFNNYKMKVLCRVTEPISKDWNPIKMFDVLTSILPSMPDDFMHLSSGKWLQNSFAQGAAQQANSSGISTVSTEQIIRKYIDIISTNEQVEILDDEKDRLIALGVSAVSDNTYTSKVNALKSIDKIMREDLSTSIDGDKLVSYRIEAMSPPAVSDGEVMLKKLEDYAEKEIEKEYYINTEVISIYW